MAAMSGAPQPDAASSRRAPHAVGGLANLRPSAPALAAAAVAGIGAAAFLWRVLAWPPAASPDAWAYAAWGQALARGERPLFELGATTPKPLSAALGLLFAPLPPARAFAVVVALALGVLAGALFAAALRDGGAVAAIVAVTAFVFTAWLNIALASAYGDVIVAALVLAGVAVRGHLRVGAFVLAGLLRPEAWVVAAVAGFLETTGPLRRRAASAVAAAAAAPALWLLADLALTGDPLGSWRFHSERLGGGEPELRPWTELPGAFWNAFTKEGAAWLGIAGLLGLGVHAFRSRRRGALDLMPLTVAVVWSLLPVLQFRFGANLQPRYLLPVVAILALGCGLLAEEILRRLPGGGSPWPAAAVTSGVLVLAALLMGENARIRHEVTRNRAIEATRPTVEAVLSCGRLGATRKTAARGVIPQLAASSRRPLREFGVDPRGRPFAAVIHFAPRARPRDPPLPPWPRRETPLGPLAVSPACRALD
jgi:hypothetical protein